MPSHLNSWILFQGPSCSALLSLYGLAHHLVHNSALEYNLLNESMLRTPGDSRFPFLYPNCLPLHRCAEQSEDAHCSAGHSVCILGPYLGGRGQLPAGERMHCGTHFPGRFKAMPVKCASFAHVSTGEFTLLQS